VPRHGSAEHVAVQVGSTVVPGRVDYFDDATPALSLRITAHDM
jgi:hypothetical protein